MRLKNIFVTALFLFLPLTACAQAPQPQYQEGIDYRTLNPAMPVEGTKGKVQVLELFWYGCPHCYELEPALGAWARRLPAHVEFVRAPAVFSRTDRDGVTPNPWYIHAKVFYAAEALGVGQRIHKPLMDAIHLQGRKLRTEDELAAFFESQQVMAKDFRAAYNSFAVETKAARAVEVTKSSGINGVPAIIINGKYQVLGQRATSYDELLAIADYLIARERR